MDKTIIESVEITGFAPFKVKKAFHFKQGINILHGSKKSGKSAILSCMAWAVMAKTPFHYLPKLPARGRNAKIVVKYSKGGKISLKFKGEKWSREGNTKYDFRPVNMWFNPVVERDEPTSDANFRIIRTDILMGNKIIFQGNIFDFINEADLKKISELCKIHKVQIIGAAARVKAGNVIELKVGK